MRAASCRWWRSRWWWGRRRWWPSPCAGGGCGCRSPRAWFDASPTWLRQAWSRPRLSSAVARRASGRERSRCPVRRRDAGAVGPTDRWWTDLRRAVGRVAVVVLRPGGARGGARRPRGAVRRAVSSVALGRIEAWVPALVVAAGSTPLTPARPGITPDHPRADRRLLIALPLVVVLVVVAGQWLVERTAVAGAPAGRVWARPAGRGGARAARRRAGARRDPPHRAGGVERGLAVGGGARVTPWPPGDVVMAVDSEPRTSGRRWSGACARSRPCRRRRSCGVTLLPCGRSWTRCRRQWVSGVGGCPPRCGLTRRRRRRRGPGTRGLLGCRASRRAVADVLVREDEHVLVTRPNGTDPLPVRVWLAPAD